MKTRSGDDYGTPLDFYVELNLRFDFTLDPCTTADNPLATPKFYTEKDNGLFKPWNGRAFVNWPYSKSPLWARKCYEESLKGCLVVGLCRYDVSTRWWQNWIAGKALVIGVPFRIHFVGADGAYNFPSALVIWHGLFQ